MNKENREDVIIQNLKDAGCDNDIITTFIEDIRDDRIDEGLKLLATHRCLLLDALHREQKRIDCLDYLVYTMQKKVKA
ncbi:MAG: hypothetical protein HDT39_17205 [Lachnospiraceae bacterium]|nr:hypothetical protein [Lachnospiraceae bacterium]